MRKVSLLATLAAGTLLLSACGDDEPTDETTPSAAAGEEAVADLGLIDDGTLTVCSEVPYPPFEIEDPDKPSGYGGFDIDVMQAVAETLGLELSVQDVAFDALTSGAVFASGQCDVAASAVTITEERQQNVDFTDPYYDSLQSLLTAADSGIAGIEDLAGKNVGVQQGTTGESYANENVPDDTTVTSFPGDAELWPALQSGSIDAILQDLPVNVEHANANPDFEIVAEFDTEEQYGFVLGKDANPELLAAINEQLQAMRDDGSYQEIYDSYFATD